MSCRDVICGWFMFMHMLYVCVVFVCKGFELRRCYEFEWYIGEWIGVD